MLREDIHVLNYPSSISLLDEEDRKEVLQKVYIDLGITPQRAFHTARGGVYRRAQDARDIWP